MIQRVCVYCGSTPGVKPIYRDLAIELGRSLAAEGLELVYGGGRVGLMGALADACLEAGGRVTGVIPRDLWDREVGHTGLTDLRIASDMHDRKAAMATLADGFIALPGGFGTLEELFEQLTWLQLGHHAKPVALLDVDGFYGPLVEFVAKASEAGFIKPAHRDLLQRAETVADAIQVLRNPPVAAVSKWVEE